MALWEALGAVRGSRKAMFTGETGVLPMKNGVLPMKNGALCFFFLKLHFFLT